MKDYIVARFFPEYWNYKRKYHYLQQRVHEASYWLSEFPEVAKSMRWVLAADHFYWNDGTKPAYPAVEDKPWIHTIGDFREYLRAAKAAGK
ncbi:MAG: hypothetical protein EOO61_05135 [Hymenobacter sp.]|nr:MAG: hypothetical protein EOO61_05135 [Hymenobacter sp.]